jgi:hypothetical protein
MKYILPILLAVSMALSSCADGIRSAQGIVEGAQATLLQIQQQEAQAIAALDAAMIAAERIGSEAAQEWVVAARDALAQIQARIPDAQAQLELADQGLQLALDKAEGRLGWVELIVGVGTALLSGGGAAIWQAGRARRWMDVARHMASVGQSIKHRAEEKGVAVADITERAARQQQARGFQIEAQKALYR